jgi:4-amino-4-deoxy-L-arabinose transferase-like glycosyltransferase
MVELVDGPAKAEVKTDWLYGAVILAFAAMVRVAFFSRGLGTDEIVYISQARHLLDGDFNRGAYLGAIRYGINAFQALSIGLFGDGVVGAGGLFFACSLANVFLAYWFALHLWGRRAAIWAGLALAVLPIAVTAAGSLNPDPYLSLVVAASIIVFYFAEQEDRAILYFLAGLLAGWVFWIKEEVLVFGLLFVFLGWPERSWRTGGLWLLIGGFICVAADIGFFWAVYGDPFYQYSVVHKDVGGWLETVPIGDSSPLAYLRYLFVDVYHTGLLGWLALAGALLMLHRQAALGRRFVLTWSIGLLVIFSALPVSFSPLTFIRKQTNYMEIFVLPLALLAGWFLAQQRRGVALVLGGIMVASGIVLAALEQQVVRVVTVNGRAAAVFAEAHAGTPVLGPLTAQRQSMVERLLHGSLDSSGDIRPVGELRRLSLIGGSSGDIVAYLVEDPQMQRWPDARTDGPLSESLRHCLLAIGPLEREDLGDGRWVVAALRSAFSLLPAHYEAVALKAIDPIWEVAPAQVYAVTRECAREAQGRAASPSPREARWRFAQGPPDQSIWQRGPRLSRGGTT